MLAICQVKRRVTTGPRSVSLPVLTEPGTRLARETGLEPATTGLTVRSLIPPKPWTLFKKSAFPPPKEWQKISKAPIFVPRTKVSENTKYWGFETYPPIRCGVLIGRNKNPLGNRSLLGGQTPASEANSLFRSGRLCLGPYGRCLLAHIEHVRKTLCFHMN